jgi:uncharacterized RDD family membrane protein YckC
MADIAATTRYSGFWHRLAGSIIDGVIVGVIGFIIYRILAAIGLQNNPALFISFFVVGLVYYIWGWGSGQTVGCMAMKMKMVDQATGGAPGYGKALLRYIVVDVLHIISIIGIIGDLWMIWDSKKQTWQDKAAGTLVVDA